MKKIKAVLNVNFILVTGILIGFCLLVLAYLIPTDKIKENVKSSVSIFSKEQSYYILVDGYECTKLDNFTDAIMLSNAFYDGNESAVEKAIHGYRYNDNSGERPAEQLVKFFQDTNGEWEKYSYARYWHGYLVILKPVLLFFSYLGIRTINKIIQTLLIVFILYLMLKRNIKKYILPFLISIFVIVPPAISMSLQFSTNIYITLVTLIILLIFYEKLKSKYIYVFLIIGMVTSFLDFLTCPILTLGMPLIFFIILNENDWKQDIKDIIILSIMWGIGYLGMWAGKWALTSIFMHENFFAKDIIQKIIERSSNETPYESFNKLDVLSRNVKMINNIPNILIITLYLGFIICKSYKDKSCITKNNVLKIIPLLLIAAMPLVWYIFASNHSYIHYWFTYRSLAVTVYSMLVGITLIYSESIFDKKLGNQ